MHYHRKHILDELNREKADGIRSQHFSALGDLQVTSHVQHPSFPLWPHCLLWGWQNCIKEWRHPLFCPSNQLHNPLSEAFSPTPRPQFSSLLCSLPETSLSSFPLPSHLPTQECWVFKEIRRYSSLKTKNHTLEIPDFEVRVLNSEGVWRPGWHPSCLLNVAFRQILPSQ